MLVQCLLGSSSMSISILYKWAHMNCQSSLELSKGTATELKSSSRNDDKLYETSWNCESESFACNHYSNCECCCTNVTCISFVSWSWLNTHIAVPCLTLKNDHPIPFPTCTAFSTISWTGSKPNLSGLRVRSLSWSNSSSEDASKPFKTIQYAIFGLYLDIWRGMNNKQISYFGWSEGYPGELADTVWYPTLSNSTTPFLGYPMLNHIVFHEWNHIEIHKNRFQISKAVNLM